MDVCNTPPVSPLLGLRPFNTIGDHDSSVTRRSGNYPPNSWDFHYLQSLGEHSTVEEKHLKLAEKLKGEVKSLISGPMEPVAKLQFVDAVQRLGLNYQFEAEIKDVLLALSKEDSNAWWVHNLHATALRFRLFRQNGIFVSQDVFETYKDRSTGEFKLNEDANGLLSLYEASFLGWEGDDILEDARIFTAKRLKDVEEKIPSHVLAKKVKHALDLPLRWRAVRYEARWYIDVYEDEDDMNSTLLRFAKLDFNIVQSFHQKEIVRLTRWWVGTGLDKIHFARNGLIQSYMYALCLLFEPHFGEVREMVAKFGALITTIDDVYDVYGSIEELQLFTESVERWNMSEVDRLPHNIGMPLVVMFNTANDIGYWSLKERGFNGIPYMHKVWADQCNSYLEEAKWLHGGYKPTLEEYLNNALVSIATPLFLITCYLQTIEMPSREIVDYATSLPPLVRATSILTRIINDLGTSPDEMSKGDTLKSIQCYMNETGCCVKVACGHMEGLVHLWWKRLNECLLEPSQFDEPFLRLALDIVRGSHLFYQYGDGFGNPEKTKNEGLSVMIHPISLDEE